MSLTLFLSLFRTVWLNVGYKVMRFLLSLTLRKLHRRRRRPPVNGVPTKGNFFTIYCHLLLCIIQDCVHDSIFLCLSQFRVGVTLGGFSVIHFGTFAEFLVKWHSKGLPNHEIGMEKERVNSSDANKNILCHRMCHCAK